MFWDPQYKPQHKHYWGNYETAEQVLQVVLWGSPGWLNRQSMPVLIWGCEFKHHVGPRAYLKKKKGVLWGEEWGRMRKGGSGSVIQVFRLNLSVGWFHMHNATLIKLFGGKNQGLRENIKHFHQQRLYYSPVPHFRENLTIPAHETYLKRNPSEIVTTQLSISGK